MFRATALGAAEPRPGQSLLDVTTGERHTCTVLDDRHGTLVQLEVPFCISPSGGGLAVFAMEEVRVAFVVLLGYAPALHAPDRQEACALVTFAGIRQVVYGYPNEEAYWKDPRGGGDVASGFHEVIGSLWNDNLDDYNRRT